MSKFTLTGFALIGITLVPILVLVGIGRTLSWPRPSDAGEPPPALHIERVTFPSESGSLIHGWFSAPELSRATILLLPPIRTTRRAMVERAIFLHEHGYSTLLIDFQATGESPGDTITFGWRERLDVLAAVEFLRRRRPGNLIGLLGVSLGGAAALLATPPLKVDAVVLEAVYPSIEKAAENRLRMRIGPLGSVVWPLLTLQLPRLGLRASDLRPIDHVDQVGCPVLVIGGLDDQHTPENDTRLLFDRARHPKHLWLISGVGHVDYLHAVGEPYRRRILDFFDEAFE